MKPQTAAWLARTNAQRIVKCEVCPWFRTDPAHCKQISKEGWFVLCMQVIKAKRTPKADQKS